MTVEIKPVGVACNLACTYCYQEPMRLAKQPSIKRDIELMMEQVKATEQDFSLFGGEALLTPKKDLIRIFEHGLEINKIQEGSGVQNSLQTNGTLIDDEHIAIFHKYRVHVGVSIDGPHELNELRVVRGKAGDDQATLDSTSLIMENMRKLRAHGISTSVIITLHRSNGTPERLPRLINFIKWLHGIGIRNGNIHTLEVDSTMPDQEIHVLSQEENIWAMLQLAEFFKENEGYHYMPFTDMKKGLEGDNSSTTCVWNHCDSMNTQAVYGIEGDGGLSNCGRTNKEGVNWHKSASSGYERYYSLYNTPHELHGCQGCRFFMVCGGSCPGEAIDCDMRNKTMYCETNKAMFSYYEKEIEEEGNVPLSKDPQRLNMENVLIQGLMEGKRYSLKKLREETEGMPIRQERRIFAIVPVGPMEE